MANLTMTNWRIVDKLPYIHLGSAGENNASTITITVDSLIENANYYLDIGDESGINLPNTQELTASTNIGTNGENIYTLSMQPLVSWLGKEGNKLLQVRCVYVENNEQIVKESNVFHAIVDRNSGFVYKYDIAVFEEYLNKIKNSGGGTGDVTQEQLDELLDKQCVTSVMPPTTETRGLLYQYIGEDTEDYLQGHYYKRGWDEYAYQTVWTEYTFPEWCEQRFDDDNNNFSLNPYDYYHNVSSFENKTFVVTAGWAYYDEAKVAVDNNSYDTTITFKIWNTSRQISVPIQADKRYVITYAYCNGNPRIKVESDFISED
jgi:hypothetical protein